MRSKWLGISITIALGVGTPSRAQDILSPRRPALSGAEQPAVKPATCEDVGRQLPDEGWHSGSRIDLSIEAPLTLIQTDGVLWYLAVCSDPGVRVLCVTYSANGMSVGDRVLRGGYNRQGPRHVVLDPCLASLDSSAP